MDEVIKVENLGKKYIISHQQERYTALRDVITDGAKRAAKKIINPKGVSLHKHEEFWALRNVYFEVNKGDRIGIIGRNGAGKSTLLKLLSRITEPTEGKIKIKGKISSLLEVGTGFHSELTGRENIYLNGAILGMSKKEIQKKFDEIIEFSGVEKFLDTPVKRYSSGMYVRLAFAVAANLEPEILIVDEVLAVGDTSFQKKCIGKMENISKTEGRTVLFVSHNMAAVNGLCSKSGLLNKGKLVNFGDTSSIISEYLKSQNVTSEGLIELTDSKLRRNSLDNSSFKFTKIEIINSSGQNASSIALKEPFALKITGQSKGKIDSDLRIGFSIDSMFGSSIFNSHKTACELGISGKSGDVKIVIKVEQNILAPGSYVIGLGANGNKIIDWIPESANINIEPVSIEGENVPAEFHGVVLYPCEWSLDTSDAS